MNTFTQWFDARNQKPDRVGNYQYRYHDAPGVAFTVYWDGSRFVIDDGSDFDGEPIHYERGDTWRGLAEQVTA